MASQMTIPAMSLMEIRLEHGPMVEKLILFGKAMGDS